MFIFTQLHSLLAAHNVNGKIEIPDGTPLRELAAKEAERIVGIFYNVVLSHVEPFVFSSFLCSPNDKRRFSDGDLQHWATYARDGGYAIQIVPSKLRELILREAKKYVHAGFFCAPMEYVEDPHAPASLESRYAILASASRSMADAAIFGLEPPNKEVEGTWEPFVRIIGFIKDQYFSHEREGRVVLYRYKECPKGKRIHPLDVILKDAVAVPYIKLFGDGLIGEHTPIERIIIGPHPDNYRRRLALESFLLSKGLSIEVCESQIPYLSR